MLRGRSFFSLSSHILFCMWWLTSLWGYKLSNKWSAFIFLNTANGKRKFKVIKKYIWMKLNCLCVWMDWCIWSGFTCSNINCWEPIGFKVTYSFICTVCDNMIYNYKLCNPVSRFYSHNFSQSNRVTCSRRSIAAWIDAFSASTKLNQTAK